jgi:hypothetical protein
VSGIHLKHVHHKNLWGIGSVRNLLFTFLALEIGSAEFKCAGVGACTVVLDHEAATNWSSVLTSGSDQTGTEMDEYSEAPQLHVWPLPLSG